MTTVTRTFKVDDVDGSEGDVGTVEFNLDGTSYEIDLSAGNADRLRERLARYVDAGTRVMPQSTRQAMRAARPVPERTARDQTRAVREWANHNG